MKLFSTKQRFGQLKNARVIERVHIFRSNQMWLRKTPLQFILE